MKVEREKTASDHSDEDMDKSNISGTEEFRCANKK